MGHNSMSSPLPYRGQSGRPVPSGGEPDCPKRMGEEKDSPKERVRKKAGVKNVSQKLTIQTLHKSKPSNTRNRRSSYHLWVSIRGGEGNQMLNAK